MKIRAIIFASALFMLPTPSFAQAPVSALGEVVGTCGTQAYVNGNLKPVTVDPQGRMCVNGSFTAGITTYTTTDKGGTLDTGGAAETAIASNASRKIWCIQNDPAETEVLTVRSGGTASATTGTALNPGQQACSAVGYVDTAAISVFASDTGHRWFGFEGQ